MTESVDDHLRDFNRRRDFATRWGGLCAGVGAPAAVFYIFMTWGLPAKPDVATGHLYGMLSLALRHEPAVRWATRGESILGLGLAMVAIGGLLAAAVITYVYNPGLFYRGMSRQGGSSGY